MKWYFACNSDSKEYIPLIKAAVTSAIANTTLNPHFIYDGEPDDLTKWLEEHGVKVIYHKSSLYPFLEKKYNGENLKKASGAYLRCDIPLIEKDDEFILYTDCDVIFLKDIEPKKPKYFSCASEVEKEDFEHFNTGVMFMNTKILNKSHKSFCKFIKQNLWRLKIWDQTAYQLYYKHKNTPLNLDFNHKAHWGINKNASIIHFHGAKPTTFTDESLIKNMDYFEGLLYKKNPESYDYYLNLFKKYFPEIQYDLSAIQKLNNGEYPITLPPKNNLLKKFKNFFKNKIMKGLS